MTNAEKELQDIARRLLEEKKVDLVIGYGRGTVPLRSVPLFVHTPEEAEKLMNFVGELKSDFNTNTKFIDIGGGLGIP